MPLLGATRAQRFAVIAAVAGFVAACGGAPTGAPAAQDSAPAEADGLEAVYSQVSDTDVQARREKLVELAKEEGGSLTWYTSSNEKDVQAIVKGFEEDTGIKVDLYRAGSSTVRQRVGQERDAGQSRADVVSATGSDPAILAKEGHYAGLDTPVTDGLVEEGVFENWFADQIYTFVPAWNTNAISPDEAPENYTEMLTNFRDGGMVVEVTDADWLFGLTELFKTEGMSEDEALQLIGDAVRASKPFDGHTAMTELTAAGQFEISPDNYHYRVEALKEKGAPIDWSPEIGPIVATFGGTGIAAGAPHPAAALLFAEYMMTDVQDTVWRESGRTPSTKDADFGIFTAPGVELFYVDYDDLAANIEKFTKLYGDMIAASGQPVQEG